MRPWQFSKPKNPGFGISKDYFLSVLACRAQLPTLLSIVSPDGAGGSVVGLGVPLARTATKEDLKNPITRGVYALSTKDKHTVLRMLVVSKEEAGFDPEAFAHSAFALSFTPDLIARIRATWTLVQLTFESHDAMVYPALDFMLSVCERLGTLTDGAIADPVCERYSLPSELKVPKRTDPRFDAREHIRVTSVVKPDGLWVRTLGMRKFGMAEFEVYGIRDDLHVQAEGLLMGLCQGILMGNRVEVGGRVGSPSSPIQIAEGGLDRAVWDGILCYELIPSTKGTINDSLEAWAAASRR
jgi:hypothetical protein